jgi:hypothetical protein
MITLASIHVSVALKKMLHSADYVHDSYVGRMITLLSIHVLRRKYNFNLLNNPLTNPCA